MTAGKKARVARRKVGEREDMHRQRRTLGASALKGAAALLLVALRPLMAGDTYSNSFDVPPREGWTDSTTKVSPTGEQFLGSFGNQTVSLTLTNLRPHTHAVVALDLYVIGAWAGSGGDAPNSFSVTLDGQQGVLEATFSNDDGAAGRPQTYPNGNPLVPDYPRRGSFQSNALGFTDVQGHPRDTTYRLIFNVRHSAPTMTLSFAGAGLPDDPTLMWGVDNVYVSTYTMDLEPSLDAFQPSGTEFIGATLGADGGGLGSNPPAPDRRGERGLPGAPGGTPQPPDPLPNDAPVVPAPGSGAIFALAAARLLARPRRGATTVSTRLDGLHAAQGPPLLGLAPGTARIGAGAMAA